MSRPLAPVLGRWLVMLGLLVLAACRSSPQTVAPIGRLSLLVVPAIASVLIDDRLLPRQSDGGLRAALSLGAHRVEVYAPGYFHAYRDIELPTATEVRIEVSLRANPDAQGDTAPAGSVGPATATP